MTTLYPAIEPYNTHHIAVGQEHILTVEECGNPSGIPVVFLHGGPGAYCKPYQRSLFNPSIYRIVLFDQRGAGRSIPTGSLLDNNTWNLLQDMEVIRERLDIENWVVFGGSWGATLGLLYAQQYPDRVLGLILRSIFLARIRDTDWGFRDGGVNRLFPKQWLAFTRFLPEGHWDNPLAIYRDNLISNNADVANTAALAWAAWSGCVVSYGEFAPPTECSTELLNEARLECHYISKHCFLEENQLLRDINKVANIPAILVHGQKDLTCPLESSYQLEQNWVAARLKIVANGGHLTRTPEMIATLVESTDEMAKMIK